MQTKYTIVKDYWYASNGCDCCEPTQMEYYTVLDEYNCAPFTDGTPFTLEAAYLAIIEGLEPTVEQYRKMLDALNVIVVEKESE